MTDRWLFRQVACQAMMGGALGTTLALGLLALNCQHLRDIIAGSPAPYVLSSMFIGGLSIYLAFGAAVTGFLFILQEEESR
jgi:hypothetical protein